MSELTQQSPAPRRVASAALCAWLLACLAACTAPAPAPSPTDVTARFTASTSNRIPLGAAVGSRIDTPACLKEAHFQGTARPSPGGMDILIDNASVAVDRQNDKDFDPLVLTVKVADGRHIFGYDNGIAYLLSPTVDSAGPQLTTWQSGDTIRMLLPWPAGPSPRWLRFSLQYRAVRHGGVISSCDGEFRSDTLRFGPRDPGAR